MNMNNRWLVIDNPIGLGYLYNHKSSKQCMHNMYPKNIKVCIENYKI